MEPNNRSAEDFEHEDQHANSQWGKKDEVEQNVQRFARLFTAAAASSEGEKPESAQNQLEEEEKEGTSEEKSPDFSNILCLEQRQMQKDEKEAEDQLAPYQEKKDEVMIDEHREDRKAYSAELAVKPFSEADKEEYHRILREVKNTLIPSRSPYLACLMGNQMKQGKIKSPEKSCQTVFGELNIWENPMSLKRQRNSR